MLEHLIDFDPEVGAHPGAAVPISKVDATDTINAKVQTVEWLTQMGAVDTNKAITNAEGSAAREAFTNFVAGMPPDATQGALTQVRTPEAVRHLVTLLSAYDWEFINQAKELRGYTVAKLVEETKDSNANVRLKALALLGKVTEVALFTERIEVKKTDLTDEEIDKKLKDKLARFMDVTDIDIEDIIEKPQPITIDEIKRPDSNAA